MFHGLSEIALEPRSFRNLPSQGQLKERSPTIRFAPLFFVWQRHIFFQRNVAFKKSLVAVFGGHHI